MTDNTTRLIQLKTNLTKIFNILNTDMVYSSEYHFVLFLLTLQKEGLLDRVFPEGMGNLYQEILHNIIVSKSKNTEIYVRIGEHFEIVLRTLRSVTLVQILNLFRNLDAYTLQENFSDIFDDLLYKLIKYRSRSGGELILPFEISQFVSNLVELPDNAKIYNPFAGLASFGVFTNENHEYLGQEVNYNTWILGQLRLIAYNRGDNSKLLFESSVEKWNPKRKYSSIKKPLEEEQYDLIIANPPFNARISLRRDIIKSRFWGAENCERFLIEKGLDDLAFNGKLIVVVSHSLLFKGSTNQELRRYLIGNDFLEMVISFPDGLLLNTAIPIAVLVISKDKKDRGVVKFIDAKSTVETASSKEKRINVAALDKIVKEDALSEHKRIVTNEVIATFDYTLHVPRYFQREIEGEPFGKLVNSISPQRNYEDTHGKLVRIRDLKEDKFEYVLDLEKIEKTELSRNVQKISESCLLVASRGKMLKPTFFEFSGEAIFISPDILALNVEESKVDIAYLVNELYTDYITEQVDAYRVGGTIPTLRKGDLLNVKIVLLNPGEQKAKVSGLIELSETIKALKSKNSALDYGLKSKHYDEFASLKHTLGTPRQNILSYADVLVSFFENNQSKSFFEVNDNFNQDLGLDLLSVFKAIKSDINFMSELLEKGEKGLVLTDYAIEAVPLTEVQNIITQYPKKGHKFTISLFSFKDENRKKLGVGINKALFRVVLDNLMSNADKHAFESKRSDNQILIDLKIIDNVFIIDIKNNGKPFPENFDKSKFIAKFSTANSQKGTGLGGYDIDRIVTYFNGNWDLFLNEEIFPVRFVFQFPIISL